MSQLEREVTAMIDECERLQPAPEGIASREDVRGAIAATLDAVDAAFDGIMA